LAVGSSPLAPPAADEFEVSLFGPGIGESVVVHLGSNDWLVADSCCALGSKTPAALEYLQGIGVDPATAVKVVVATHWHDDHISGISKVLEAAHSAKFFCSAALNGAEFLKFISHYRRNGMQAASSGVDEMCAVFRLLREARNDSGRSVHSVGPEWVKANECLWRRGALPATVHALSPSAGALTLALQEFGVALDTIKPRKRAVAQTPNEVAVALWAEVGGVRVLLGSDLEDSGDSNCGWQAIVTSTARPPGRAHILKVPHHGSETAHNEDVWTQLLEAKPHAVLTTFTSGTPLPTPKDITRLLERAATLHATTPPRAWSPHRREPAVERTAKNVVTNRRVLKGQLGHVRMRCKVGEAIPTFSIDLFGPALELVAE
jgi:beta-lactamase superfamily II metal-dependent hydrolase